MIRKNKNEDINRIVEIWLEASYKAHDFIDKSYWQSNADQMRDLYIPNSETYVFIEKGIICGFFSLADSTLAAIFVDPEYQGKGIGSQLLSKAKSIRSKLELAVYKENTISHRFYKNKGFKDVREQVDKNTGKVEIVMAWN